MKKTQDSDQKNLKQEDLLPEYEFDYRKSRSNRFAEMLPQGSVVVALDSDVARVFHNAKEVNRALRALIKAIPNFSPGDDTNSGGRK